ncbi:unnamed protein product [Adineta ricciae]|uniref:Uncharacterized protein n=1 Tax=Adineta ricciae TaxID=249248 RepID=A0A814YQ34_ADIRI|nr:unnamed protein product [Adineta ricciae]CAF1618494.1 unnamed protein product [Adineta ricciae]
MDTHYFCGRDSYLTRFTYDFCLLSTKTYVAQLNLNGQLYFNYTNKCVMKLVDERLTEPTISARFTCTDLQKLMFENHLQCLQNYPNKPIDFCTIICDNLQVIINLFLHLNQQTPDIYRLLIQTGRNCGATIRESPMMTIPSILMSICLDRKNARLKDDITNVMLNRRYEFNDYEWISD